MNLSVSSSLSIRSQSLLSRRIKTTGTLVLQSRTACSMKS